MRTLLTQFTEARNVPVQHFNVLPSDGGNPRQPGTWTSEWQDRALGHVFELPGLEAVKCGWSPVSRSARQSRTVDRCVFINRMQMQKQAFVVQGSR